MGRGAGVPGVEGLRDRLRHLLWLYPAAMALALVYSGEHYVCEIVLGWIYTVAVYVAVERGFAALAARRAARAEPVAEGALAQAGASAAISR